MNQEEPKSRWEQLVPHLRNLPNENPSTEAPLGFATRIVAQANLTARISPLARFRNWSLLLAGASVCSLVIATTLHEPAQQFLPLPDPELPANTSR